MSGQKGTSDVKVDKVRALLKDVLKGTNLEMTIADSAAKNIANLVDLIRTNSKADQVRDLKSFNETFNSLLTGGFSDYLISKSVGAAYGDDTKRNPDRAITNAVDNMFDEIIRELLILAVNSAKFYNKKEIVIFHVVNSMARMPWAVKVFGVYIPLGPLAGIETIKTEPDRLKFRQKRGPLPDLGNIAVNFMAMINAKAKSTESKSEIKEFKYDEYFMGVLEVIVNHMLATMDPYDEGTVKAWLDVVPFNTSQMPGANTINGSVYYKVLLAIAADLKKIINSGDIKGDTLMYQHLLRAIINDGTFNLLPYLQSTNYDIRTALSSKR